MVTELLTLGARTGAGAAVFDCPLVVQRPGRHVNEQYEGWIAADSFRGGVRVVIRGPQGFERSVLFVLDEDPPVITGRVRETIDNDG